MPIYDRACRTCGWTRADCYEPAQHEEPCPHCGTATVREWTASRIAVHGDDKYIGGLTLENLGHRPVTVYSRAEYKRELAARGLQESVRHVGLQGSDKNPNTTRWV